MCIMCFQYMSEKIGNENDKTTMDEEFIEMERVCIEYIVQKTGIENLTLGVIF